MSKIKSKNTVELCRFMATVCTLLILGGYSFVAQGQVVATAGNLYQGTNSDPDLAIDGDTNGVYGGGSVFHSQAVDTNEWWQLDLGSSQYIEDVTIYNRTDGCCERRLSYVHVFISDTDFTTAGASGVDDASFLSAEATATFENDLGLIADGDTAPKTVIVGATGRYIRLQKSGVNNANSGNIDGNALNFAELEYSLSIDYGDAPDSYNTLQSSDGASHSISSDLFLGDTVADTDTDGFVDGTDDSAGAATDDDLDTNADEGIAQLLSSGSSFPTLEDDDIVYSLGIDLSNSAGSNANLYAWIDFDGNGTFDEDEIVTAGPITIADGATSATISWTSMPGLTAGSTYARFRLTSDTLTFVNDGGEDERTSGLASDGEVEDYVLTISTAPAPGPTASLAVFKTNSPAGDLLQGDSIDYTVTVQNTSTAALSGIDVTDAVPTNTTFDAVGTVTGAREVLIYLDQFDTNGSLTGDDGNASWSTDWIRDSGQDVQVTTGASETYVLRLQDNDREAYREFDLIPVSTACVSVTLSFDFATNNLGADDFLEIIISEGGASAVELDELGNADVGNVDDVFTSFSYDISAYAFNNTRIEFETTNTGQNNGNDQYVDNVMITAVCDVVTGLASGTAPNLLVSSDAPYSNGDAIYGLDDSESLTVTYSVTVGTGLANGTLISNSADTDSTETAAESSNTVANTVVWPDFGDAPIVSSGDYDDTNSNGAFDIADAAARHKVSTALRLGSVAAEGDSALWGDGTDDNGDASDDDTPGDPVSGIDDEDGIASFGILTVTDSSYSVTATVQNSTGVAANLYAWIDFDNDGLWEESERATLASGGTVTPTGLTVPGSANGTVILDWTPPALTSGNRYVRVRLSTDDLDIATGQGDGVQDDAATGLAEDGEVEDFQLTIFGYDYGDAAATYPDALHSFPPSPDLYIGAIAPDEELATPAGTGIADGDDTDAGGDDEDASLVFTGLSSLSTGTFSLDVDVVNSGAAATLVGWIDFDGSNTFEADEGATVAVSATGTVTLDFDLDSLVDGVAAGTTYARLRITRDAVTTASFSGTLDYGEVEDHQLEIGAEDFGDAPAAYSDPSHVFLASPSLFIGLTGTGGEPDAETAAQDSADADADDLAGDDESTISITGLNPLEAGSTYLLDVNVSNASLADAGTLFGWIDFDGDEVFSSDEATSVTVPVSTAGTVQLSWTVPVDIAAGDTFARFRITTDPSITTATPGTRATDGEVEDQALTIDVATDYGDAPLGYGDASHILTSSLPEFYIGASGDQPDSESAAQNSAGADGDDTDTEGDDEDGVASFDGLVEDQAGTYTVSVDVTHTAGAAATLLGWIDFDQSGTFEADEAATLSSGNVTASGTVVLSFDLDALVDGVVGGVSYARFRISRDSMTTADFETALSDGEVEDYPISILEPVYFEAECSIAGSAWTANFDTAASQNVYFESVINRTDATLSGGQGQSDLLEYQVTVPVAGTYDLYLLYENPSTTDQDDSLYYSIDNSIWATINNTPTGVSGYNWVNLASYVSGGTYQTVTTTSSNEAATIYITYREDGIRLDKFALLPTGASIPTGQGDDVGSCFDFGDAPDTTLNSTGPGDYISLIGNSTPGPIHMVDDSPAVYLGSQAPDTEADALQTSDASGDDSPDEGEAQLVSTGDSDSFPALSILSTSFSVEIDVTNSKAVDATVIAWIDANDNGDFEVGEQADSNPVITASSGATQTTLTWSSLSGLTEGSRTMRVRISTDSSLATRLSTGVLIDGEVEDYSLEIGAIDFGDAPGSGLTYNTLLADGGPSHITNADIYLGDTGPDGDSDGYSDGTDSSGSATDDDSDGGGDEGVTQLLSSGSAFLSLEATDTSYQITLDLFNNSGSTAQLYAWIDFDQSGSFDEDEIGTVATTLNSSASNQSVTISWSGLGPTVDIASGQTYARFRLTTDTLATDGDADTDDPDARADGAATDGEVEDYAIGIGNLDYGDAPDLGSGQAAGDYRTLLADDGPRHTIDANIYLGDTAPDIDTDGFEEGTDNTGTAGDDEQNGGDEGLTQLLTSGSSFDTLTTTDSSYAVTIDMNNSSGGAVRVFSWIDFDQSGTFDEDEASDESGSLIGAVSSHTANWSSIPSDTTDGVTYVRYRITSDPLSNNGSGEDERSYGAASSGEVEDYAIVITGVDFGDAPDSYGTTEASSGPSHTIVAGIQLGDTAADGEVDGFVDGSDDNLFASDDDANGDEGIDQLLNGATASFPTLNATDTGYTLTVDLASTGNAIVYGWIDFDNDGLFEQSERTDDDSVILSDTTATLSWTGLSGLVVGNTYARFRIATDGVISDVDGTLTGIADDASLSAATDGEVEDYLITISGNGSISGTIFEDPNYGGGAGRDYTTADASYAATDVGTQATVQLWTSDGSTCLALSQTTTSSAGDGAYNFSGVTLPGDYCVRVLVNASVQTNRTGLDTGVPVQTYRVESTDGLGTLTAVTDEIGGRTPSAEDSLSGTFNSDTHSWSLVSVSSSGISGIDFGYSFNTIVNTNSTAQGSLSQFIENANLMTNASGDGLAQLGQTAGIDVSIFEIPTSDANYNLAGQGEYSISLAPVDDDFAQIEFPIELNGTTQSGASCPNPIIEVDGSLLTGGIGVDLGDASDGSTVRGFVFNGFDSSAIRISAASDGNTIACNYIGTDVGGNVQGNGGNGLGIDVAGDNNQIGGDSSTEANVISGNTGLGAGTGLQITGDNNTVQGNNIGLGEDSATQLSNTSYGIYVSGSDNSIGDASSSVLRNRIAYNGDDGVRVETGTGNKITSNTIFNNAGLGLNLVGGTETNNVSANDALDADSGSNNLLNYIEWDDLAGGGGVTQSGSDLEYSLSLVLPTTAGAEAYRIEFYANAVCNADQSGVAQTAQNGEGQQLLGSISFTSSGGTELIDSSSDLGDNFVPLSGVVSSLVGNQITALVVNDDSGDTSEFSLCDEPAGLASQVISGTVFEDVNYGGGSGRNYAAANADYLSGGDDVGVQATVELWASDGVLCTGGAPLQTVSTDSQGDYSFNALAAVSDDYCIRVINSSVQSNRAGWISSLIPVQTFKTESTGGTGVVVEVIDEVGGESPQDVDVSAGVYDRTANDGSISQTLSFIDLPETGDITGLDFGFNFDTVVNVNASGQGSLAQFIASANALGDEADLAQSGNRLLASSESTEALPTLTETSIFMISNGEIGVDGINPTRASLLISGRYADITLSSDITISDDATNLDGTTQSANVENGNFGQLGTFGDIGTAPSTLPSVYRPEIQVSGGMISLTASDVEVRGVAFIPTATALNVTSAANVLIENNLFGSDALTFDDPATGGSADLLIINGTGSGTRSIHNNLFGFGDEDGLYLTNTSGWTITENEFQSFDSGVSTAGLHIGDATTGLSIDTNLFEANSYGLRLNNGSGASSTSTIQNNSILSNSRVGLMVESAAVSDDDNTITDNIISLNGDDGVQLNAGSGNEVSQNSIYNNEGLGINLNGGNAGTAISTITSAVSNDGVNVDVIGTYAGLSTDTLEFYSSTVCNGDTAGTAQVSAEGEGQQFHSTTDSDAGTGFSVSIAIADLVGTVLTMLSTDGSENTSEFSDCFTGLVADWGDAPDSYGTLQASSGPNHIRTDFTGGTNNRLLLGASVDAEEDGNVTGGDASADGADDDGVSSFDTLTTASSSYSVDVSLINDLAADIDAYLVAWIDFDINGTFDSNEAAMVTVADDDTSATLTWSSLPIDIAVGSTFVRLRLASYSGAMETPPVSASTASPLGAATDGEVEDYQISIEQGYDYGDAPEDYDIANAPDGAARHLLDGNSVYLGIVPPDGDAASFGGDGTDNGYSFTSSCISNSGAGSALDDDCEGSDDEDSATVIGLTPDGDDAGGGTGTYSVQALVTNNTGGNVYAWAWLDIDQDDDFGTSGDGTERTGGLVGTGVSVVTFEWDLSGETFTSGETYLRIRVSSDADMNTDGAGSFDGDYDDGEVEDYRIVISELTCDLIYGQYNNGTTGTSGDQYRIIRAYTPGNGTLGSYGADLADTDDGNPASAVVGSAGAAIDPVTRRYYYAEWSGDNNADAADIDMYYFDGANEVEVTNDQVANADENWNRFAFNPEGVGYIINSDTFEIKSFDTTSETFTSVGTITNFWDDSGSDVAVGFTGGGGDAAFDIDGNLYMVTYDGGGTNLFYLWLIEDLGTATPDARLQISQASGGNSVAGIAFYSDGLLYLQDSTGSTYSWSIGDNVAVNLGDVGDGSADLASCIYPKLIPVLDVTKTVENTTDPASLGFAPGDELEYSITIRNTGAIVAQATEFWDAIPTDTTYVANSTYVEQVGSGAGPVLVADVSGNFPYLEATPLDVTSDGQSSGILAAVSTIDPLQNAVIVTFSVTVDGGTGFDQVCNINGIAQFNATGFNNAISPIATNDPSTPASAAVVDNGGTLESSDPTCLDKFSGYSIEGYVFDDLDSDELFEIGDAEIGISNVEVVLKDASNVCQSVRTNSSGYYFFGPLDTGIYTVYESNGASVPTPSVCPPVEADPSGYVSTTANSITSVNITSENIVDQNLGDVQAPDLTPSNSNVVLPGNTVFYAHEFETPASGDVIFTTTESGSPTPSGWSIVTSVYDDVGCTNEVDTDITVIAGETYCVIVQVTAPFSANAGDTHITTLTATFDYPGSFVSNVVLNVTDTTTVLSAGDGALVLSKLVENLTCAALYDGGAGDPADYCSYDTTGAATTDNNAQPGDLLRYAITFQNIGTTAISGIDIYDTIPAYTALDVALDTDCAYTESIALPGAVEGSDFTSATGITACDLIVPDPGSIENVPGFDGSLQWRLTGSFAAGASGTIAFDVIVD